MTGAASPRFSWGGICLDCRDVEPMVVFYRELFGWEETGRDTPETAAGGSGWVCLSGPAGGPSVSFQAEDWYEPPVWPEPSSGAGGVPTKMLHFEVAVDDLDAAVAAVVRAGGQVAPWQPGDRNPAELRIVLDPAGHPFCLCAEP
jgi:catechol 2,3-dioxygenase-like lactoylglutathione lyase family enzyme